MGHEVVTQIAQKNLNNPQVPFLIELSNRHKLHFSRELKPNDFWFINTGLGRVCVMLRHGAAFDVSLQQIQRRGVGARHELQEAGHPALAAGTICMWCTSLLTHTHVNMSL